MSAFGEKKQKKSEMFTTLFVRRGIILFLLVY